MAKPSPQTIAAQDATPSPQAPALPEEILELIVAQLDYSGLRFWQQEQALSRKTLAALCLASKQCLRLAQPLLYRSPSLTSRPPLLALSRTFAASARLADLVHEVRIEDWELEEGGPEDQQSVCKDDPRFAERQALYAEALRPLGGLADSELNGPLLDALESCVYDANLAFIILRCRHVETLSLTTPEDFPYSWIAHVVAAAAEAARSEAAASGQSPASRQKHLTRLKVLRAENPNLEFSTRFTDFAHVLRLPSIETFESCRIDIDSEDAPTAIPPLDLRSVSIQYSMSDARALRTLLAACARLTSLSVEWNPAERDDHIRDDLEFPDPSFYDVNEAEPLTSVLAGLRALTALTELRLPAVVLFGRGHWDFRAADLAACLPTSLAKLHVSDWRSTETYRAHGEGTLRELLQQMPSLDEVMTTGTERATDEEGGLHLQQWRTTLEKRSDGFVVGRETTSTVGE